MLLQSFWVIHQIQDWLSATSAWSDYTMPIEVPTAISAAASAGNALITLCKYGLHYVEIPEEVQDFRVAIENLQQQINTSKRLRRVRSAELDSELKDEVDHTIRRSERILDSVSRTIEACRADLETKGTVRMKTRLRWLFQGHDAFISRGAVTLNSCLACLISDISRMNAVQHLPFVNLPPPSYRESTFDSLSPGRISIAPSLRKARSRSMISSRASVSNMSTFSYSPDQNICTEKEVVVERLRSLDSASIVSTDEGLCARVTSVPDPGCLGDYCTDHECLYHTRRESHEDLSHTMSLDTGIDEMRQDWPRERHLQPEIFRPTASQSTRRRHRAGLI